MAALIELDGITKNYQLEGLELKILKGISLKIDAGEFVSIIGPSGSGKSTLMHIMGLLDNASGGKLRIMGQDISALSDRSGHRPSQMSGGQQQRVAIARALKNNPKIIFADEPTGNLETRQSQEIIELLRNLNREKCITFGFLPAWKASKMSPIEALRYE